MKHYLFIRRQAEKKLKSLPRPDRNRITEKIILLGKNPDDPTLDIKALKGEPFYRLRIGNWRIIFDRKSDIRIITIEKIKPRGDAYK